MKLSHDIWRYVGNQNNSSIARNSITFEQKLILSALRSKSSPYIDHP